MDNHITYTALVLVEDSDEEEAFVPVTIPPEQVNHPVYWEEPKLIIKRNLFSANHSPLSIKSQPTPHLLGFQDGEEVVRWIRMDNVSCLTIPPSLNCTLSDHDPTILYCCGFASYRSMDL